jgi:hypothetical protein
LDSEEWSDPGLLELIHLLRGGLSKAEQERYRRLPPAETGAGLLGMLAHLKGGEA